MFKKARTTLFSLLWVFASMVASQYVVYYPMLLLLGNRLQQPGWNALYTLLSSALALFLTLFIPYKLFRQGKLTRESLGLTSTPKLADIALAPIGFVVYTIATTALTGLFSKFPFFDADQVQNLGVNTGNLYFWQDKLAIFVALTIIVPITEEVIFRGWLYGHLRAHIPGRASMLLSIFLTSLLFAILHGQWNIGINVFCLSVVLCLLREVTGTIYSGILLHMAKNFIALVLLYMS